METSSIKTEASSDATVLSNINVSSSGTKTVGEADTFINLGDNITVDGEGVTIDNNIVTITSKGTYSIKGTLADGQIVVNAGDDDNVDIILNGVNITSSNSAPIYIKNAKNAVISLADDTQNYIKDGENYVYDDQESEEPNSAIFSKCDLFLIGNGSLTVDGQFKNGITSKDDLEIQGGNITVSSKGDGIKGKDSVAITNGNITINSGEDGIKSNNDEDSQKGYVLIEGGKISITCGQDGIQAETNVFVKDGDITINSGGGNAKATPKQDDMGGPGMAKQDQTETAIDNESEDISSKAIKAGVNIITEGGTLNIDSSEDALHSNNNLVINSGTFNIYAGDDGLHADSTLTINNGSVSIEKSYEGIESKTITINDGNIKVISNDDGINASNGSDASAVQGGGKPGNSSDGSSINIYGGYMTVNAEGDGIDSNGSVLMKGGTVIVNGPTNNGNGCLDYNGNFEVTGGTLIAAGSSGMAQSPSTESTQNSIKVNLSSQAANTIVHIESEDGEEIITLAPSKQYSSLVITSSKIKTGSTYKVYVGGTSTGKVTDGVYSEGTYTKGEEVGSATISNSQTEITQEGVTNTKGMGGPGGGGHRNQAPQK